jgi:hypothetical protein
VRLELLDLLCSRGDVIRQVIPSPSGLACAGFEGNYSASQLRVLFIQPAAVGFHLIGHCRGLLPALVVCCDEHIDTRLKLAILFFKMRCSSRGSLVFNLELRDLVGEVGYCILKLSLSVSRRLLHYRRACPGAFNSLVQRLNSGLKFGHSNRSHSGGRQILNHPQFLLPKSPMIEHPNQPDGAGRASQRVQCIRIGIMTRSAAL